MKRLLVFTVLIAAVIFAWIPAHAAPSGSTLRCPGPANLTAAGGQSANGDTYNWLDAKRRYLSLQVCYTITGTATMTLYSSIDDGVTWNTIAETASATSGCYTIYNPIGLLKGTISGVSATPNVVVRYECGVE